MPLINVGAGLSLLCNAPAWATLVDQSPSGTNTGWAAFTDCQIYLVGAFAGRAPAAGKKVRVTFKGPAAGSADVINAYIGHQGPGDPYDFDGNQVQLKVSNNGAFTVGTGATVLTDDANFSFDRAKALVVRFAFGTTSAIAQQTGLGTNFVKYFIGGDVAATTDLGAASAPSSGHNDFVDLVEVFG